VDNFPKFKNDYFRYLLVALMTGLVLVGVQKKKACCFQLFGDDLIQTYSRSVTNDEERG